MILRPKRPKPPKLSPLDKMILEETYSDVPVEIVQHCKVLPLA